MEGPNETGKYVSDPVGYLASVSKEMRDKPFMLRSRLETIQKLSQAYSTGTYKSCVEMARNMF